MAWNKSEKANMLCLFFSEMDPQWGTVTLNDVGCSSQIIWRSHQSAIVEVPRIEKKTWNFSLISLTPQLPHSSCGLYWDPDRGEAEWSSRIQSRLITKECADRAPQTSILYWCYWKHCWNREEVSSVAQLAQESLTLLGRCWRVGI